MQRLTLAFVTVGILLYLQPLNAQDRELFEISGGYSHLHLSASPVLAEFSGRELPGRGLTGF
jgi:hypothetical protein